MKPVLFCRTLVLAVLLATGTAAAAQQTEGTAENAPGSLTPAQQQELLFDAAKLGRADIIRALAAAGVDMNIRDSRGFTPLVLAAYYGSRDGVAALVKAGADVNLPDERQGNTALMSVAFKGHDDIAELLIEAGADVNARNKAGQTALMTAALFDRTKQVNMLLAAGADATLVDVLGHNAYDIARRQGNERMMDQLAPHIRK